MAKQKLKLKGVGLKPTSYWELIAEAVEKIRNLVHSMTNKMWEIGKVLDEQIKKFPEKQYKGGEFDFYNDVSEKLEIEVTPQHLKDCVSFYRRYPDLQEKVKETGLTPTHYERLSHLPIKEAEKFEKKAVEMKWTVRELREKAFPQRIELNISDTIENYHEFVDNLTGLEDTMEKLRKSKLEGLSKSQIDGMARSLYVLIIQAIPKFVEFLMKHDAKIDPNFRKYVEKFVK